MWCALSHPTFLPGDLPSDTLHTNPLHTHPIKFAIIASVTVEKCRVWQYKAHVFCVHVHVHILTPYIYTLYIHTPRSLLPARQSQSQAPQVCQVVAYTRTHTHIHIQAHIHKNALRCVWVKNTYLEACEEKWWYRVAKTHKMLQVAGHFSQKKH